MAFQFTLHAVLGARVLIEEREERLLKKILVEIAHCNQEIAYLDEEMIGANRARSGSVLQESLGRTLHGQYGQMQELKRVRDQLLIQVEKLEELKEQQLAIYTEARRNRELLTDMRTTKREAYDIELSRREQSTLDDNFIARRGLF